MKLPSHKKSQTATNFAVCQHGGGTDSWQKDMESNRESLWTRRDGFTGLFVTAGRVRYTSESTLSTLSHIGDTTLVDLFMDCCIIVLNLQLKLLSHFSAANVFVQ